MKQEVSRGSMAVRAVMWGLVVVIAGLTGYILVQQGAFDSPPRVALVTADESDYWEPVIAGAKAAADNRNITLTIRRANGQPKNQTEILEELIEEGYDAVAVSPVDADKQSGSLRRMAERVHLVTLDSDSELSDRICFVGCDNYSAGRRCGQLVAKALPEGGEMAIVIGSLEKANGRLRRQGLIDELLERSYDPDRSSDPVDKPLSGPRFTIVGTYVDDTDAQEATANVRKLIAEHPEIDGIVGLYGYSTPAILEALESEQMLGEIAVVGFDYSPRLLEGIEKGEVYGTIVQDQFNYGMRAIDILAVAARGGDEAEPLADVIHYPTVPVTAENLAEFRSGFIKQRSAAAAARLNSRIGG